MRVPGSNILNMALSVIAKQTVTYYQATGRTINNVGQYVTVYATGAALQGSFQAVSRNLYQTLGLDFQKAYYNFYASKDIIDVTRDVSADQIVFGSDRYQCLSSQDWFGMDGWVGVLCVLIPSTG